MAGGMRAWHGVVAAGPPDAGMALFPASASAQELTVLAWHLEAGSRAFYAGLAGFAEGAKSRALFELLGRAEDSHLQTLTALYRELAVGAPEGEPGLPALAAGPGEAVMEGGVDVAHALTWARGRGSDELLEYCMGLEANSWDLYLRMRRAVSDAAARRVFLVLAEEEKRHLETMSQRFEDRHGVEGT